MVQGPKIRALREGSSGVVFGDLLWYPAEQSDQEDRQEEEKERAALKTPASEFWFIVRAPGGVSSLSRGRSLLLSCCV